jgi:hypothetical protein
MLAESLTLKGVITMSITIGTFVVEASFSSLYIRLPLIGAAFIGEGMTCFDSWKKLTA